MLGFDVRRQARQVRGRVGYVFGGDRGLYDRLSALDNLRYFADLYRVPARSRRARIDSLLELVDLKGRERERVETYSRGMKQRLHIARGLLHDPEVLFLDEPTIGLDPVGARELRDTIGGLHSTGKTILLTTHYMYEADALCQRVAVIAGGTFVATGTPADLKAVVEDQTIVEIETFGVGDDVIARLRRLPGVKGIAVETRDQAQVPLVQSAVGADVVRALLNELAGARTGRIVTREPTLEDAYVELVRATIGGCMLLVSGANVPLDRLPAWVQRIAFGIPLTHGIEAARAISHGASISAASDLLIEEAAIGGAYLLVGLAMLRLFEYEGRRSASLETF